MEDSSSRFVVSLKNSSKIVFRWIAKTSLNLIIIVVLFPGYVIAFVLDLLGAILIEVVKTKSVQDNNYTAYRRALEAEKASEEPELWPLRTRALFWTVVFYVGLIWYMGLQGAIATTQSLYKYAVLTLLGLGYLIIQNIVTALST